ncbi:MAG: AAA family ATPase [Bacillota bacterium]
MKIEAIRIKNYKVFRDVTIRDIPKMAVFLGANGSGKSTLFDVFGFLKDALANNVSMAMLKRGGFEEVVSRESDGPVEFEFKFRSEKNMPLVTYEIKIANSPSGPVVQSEILKYRRGSKGKPWHFLDFRYGEGEAILEDDPNVDVAEAKRDTQKLEKPDILAIKGLGQFQKFRQVMAFRRLVENWYVSDLHISYARQGNDAGVSEHLNTMGDNLAQYAKYVRDQHPKVFSDILTKMAEKIPGISEVSADTTIDGRIILRFKDGSFKDPFLARYASDGTVKMFAYLLLLSDPKPFPLLCIEEPENQLHHDLMIALAEELRMYAMRGGQVFVSTHSPDFVNALEPKELFWLTKKDGYSQVSRADDDKLVVDLYNDGDLLGYLWKSGFLSGAGIR